MVESHFGPVSNGVVLSPSLKVGCSNEVPTSLEGSGHG